MKTGQKRRTPPQRAPGPASNGRRHASQGSVSQENGITSRPLNSPLATPPNIVRQETEEAGDQAQSPSDRNFELTSLLPGDVEAVETLISEAQERIIRTVTQSQQKLFAEVKQQETEINAVAKSISFLDANVSLLKNLTMQNSAVIARGQSPGTSSTRSKKKNGKSSFEEDVEALNPTIEIELKAVFDPLVMCRTAAYCISSYTDFFHGTPDDVRMTGRVLTVLLYGLKRNRTMNDYKEGVGKQLANFRFKMARNATRSALLISEDTFRERAQQALADFVRDGGSDAEMMPNTEQPIGKPTWLSEDVLTQRILKMARKQHDRLKSEWDPIPRAATERKALYVSRHVYKIVMDMLGRSREGSRQKMFGTGSFLLVYWRYMKPLRDGHCNPTVRFLHPTVRPMSPKDIEDTQTWSHPRHIQHNASPLKQLISARKEMIVETTYNVTVLLQRNTRNERSRNERSSDPRVRVACSRSEDIHTEIREMKRHISFLGIAVIFMEAYSQAPQETFLASHQSMIRNIYRVALVLREFFIDQLVEDSRLPRAPRSSAAANSNREDELSMSCCIPVTGAGPPTAGTLTSPRGEESKRDANASNLTESRDTDCAVPDVQLRDMLCQDSEADKEMTKILHMSSETFEKVRVRSTEFDYSIHSEDAAENEEANALESDAEEDGDGMFDK